MKIKIYNNENLDKWQSQVMYGFSLRDLRIVNDYVSHEQWKHHRHSLYIPKSLYQETLFSITLSDCAIKEMLCEICIKEAINEKA